MYKTWKLALLLLISAVWLQAKSASPASDKKPSYSDPITVQGCLQSSMGQYNLVYSNGAVDVLTGAAKKLRPLVGHEVEVTGKPGFRTSDSTPVGGASSVKQEAVFEVKTVKQIADTCKTTGQ